MKVPEKASGVTVYYGEVYVESPGFPEDERDMWSVWDPPPSRCARLEKPVGAAESKLHRPQLFQRHLVRALDDYGFMRHDAYLRAHDEWPPAARVLGSALSSPRGTCWPHRRNVDKTPAATGVSSFVGLSWWPRERRLRGLLHG